MSFLNTTDSCYQVKIVKKNDVSYSWQMLVNGDSNLRNVNDFALLVRRAVISVRGDQHNSSSDVRRFTWLIQFHSYVHSRSQTDVI